MMDNTRKLYILATNLKCQKSYKVCNEIVLKNPDFDITEILTDSFNYGEYQSDMNQIRSNFDALITDLRRGYVPCWKLLQALGANTVSDDKLNIIFEASEFLIDGDGKYEMNTSHSYFQGMWGLREIYNIKKIFNNHIDDYVRLCTHYGIPKKRAIQKAYVMKGRISNRQAVKRMMRERGFYLINKPNFGFRRMRLVTGDNPGKIDPSIGVITELEAINGQF